MFRALLATSLGVATVVAVGVGFFAAPEASTAPAKSTAAEPQLSQLLGFTKAALVRVDPQSLQPLDGKRIQVGSGGCAPRVGGTACWSIPPWAVSQDGKQLAVARNDASSLRLVDVGRMRVTANIGIHGGAIGALAWLAPRRVVAVQEIPGERQRLLVVDLVKRRVAARHALGGSVQQLAQTSQELVMLLAPAKTIGPSKIAVANRLGAVRFVRLERILAGSKVLATGSDHRVDAERPGLDVAPQSRRAFVVGNSVVAEIDLRNLEVSYATLEPRTLLSQLKPASATKQGSGHVREARWLGGNLLAISGADTEESRTQPAGLLIADTRGWSVRMIDRGATGFEVAGDLLLATGGSWDEVTGRATGMGLAAYAFDGRKRFQIFDGEQAWLAQVYGGRAYVGIAGQDRLNIIDLAAGAVVGARAQPLPWLVLGEGAGWWGR
jgi:hypothetical protein